MTIQENLDWLASTLLADAGAPAMCSAIQPLAPGWRLFAPALTVRVPPGDNLAVHLALTLARPGEVLVVDGGGETERALMGHLMCTHAAAAGLAGVVIDGVIRDRAELCHGSLPVFARGASPHGPFKEGGGAVLAPIRCGGVAIEPGDWLFGDADGVVVLPRGRRQAILDGAAAKLARERDRLRAIGAGRLEPDWLAAALAGAGVDVGQR